MTTIAQELTKLHAARTRALNERKGLADTLAKIAKQNPSGLSDPAAIAQVGDIRARKANLDAEVDQLAERIAGHEATQAEDDEEDRCPNASAHLAALALRVRHRRFVGESLQQLPRRPAA